MKYVHTPLPSADIPFCRSWAFNVGARLAQGELLVLHDNDILAPSEYTARHLAHVRDGYQVVNLKRFIFFLDPAHSERLMAENEHLLDEAPESIMENAEGGGSQDTPVAHDT